MSNELNTTDDKRLKKLVTQAVENGKAKELVALLSSEIEKSKPSGIQSADKRRAAIRKLSQSGDKTFLTRLKTVMASYVTKHVVPVVPEEDLPVRLSPSDVDHMAEEWLDYKLLNDTLTDRQKLMRERVFGSLDDKYPDETEYRIYHRKNRSRGNQNDRLRMTLNRSRVRLEPYESHENEFETPTDWNNR